GAPRDAGIGGAGGTGAGCLEGGLVPPSTCTFGKDPVTGSPWVVCAADCNSVWISADTMAAPPPSMTTYHAVAICSSLGYTRLSEYGGDCGNVCGYCEQPTSCMSPGNAEFHQDGVVSNGADGPVLGFTVHWLCLRQRSAGRFRAAEAR